MEGYFWRFSDRASGQVLIALCGVCRDGTGPWGDVAVAAHPQRLVHEATSATARADRDCLAVRADGLLAADSDRLSVDLGPAASLDVVLRDRVRWPRRVYGGLGPAHWVPGLGQYWHPHLLGGRAEGEARIGGQRIALDGMQVYAEKNWGHAFPRRWWWGQAQGFDDEHVCVAFAGGELPGAPFGACATAVVARVGALVVRLSLPTAVVRVAADGSGWWLRGRGARYAVELEGTAVGEPYTLPVPVPDERRSEPRARQQLAGRLTLRVRRGRRLLFAGETEVAGLELSTESAAVERPRVAALQRERRS